MPARGSEGGPQAGEYRRPRQRQPGRIGYDPNNQTLTNIQGRSAAPKVTARGAELIIGGSRIFSGAALALSGAITGGYAVAIKEYAF